MTGPIFFCGTLIRQLPGVAPALSVELKSGSTRNWQMSGV